MGGGGIVAAQGVAVAFRIDCPRCGLRPYTEFTFGGELRDVRSADPDGDFERVYLPSNAAGPQAERWFHAFGCRRWLTITRDTVTNRVDGVDRVRG
jgi:heterotetrameric sarcosine oxidase delta subunit